MSIAENDWREEKILITVKTYPTPSRKYRELVCTAGITAQGEWIRLYPVPYRYLTDDQQYRKYAWITARIRRKSADHRPDSFAPDIDTLSVLNTVGSHHQWSERNGIILPTISPSLEFLNQRYQESHRSLGIFKPRLIQDFSFTENTDVTSSRIRTNEYIAQLGLLDEVPPKSLEPMPYNFRYKFLCDDPSCSGHNLIVIDWEIYSLFRNLRRKYDEHTAIQKVRDKWFNQMCSSNRDTYFIVGTDKQYGHFMILGVYWPPKSESLQVSLF